jgi:hypothetical protein
MRAVEATEGDADTRSAELFVVACVLVSTTLFNPFAGLAATVGTVALGRIARRYGRFLRASRRPVAVELVTPAASVLEVRSTPRVAGHVVDELFERAINGDVIADSQLRILARLCPDESRLRHCVKQLDDRLHLTAVG